MKFEPVKFLQNVHLKLLGRTAMLVVCEGVLLVAFWMLLNGYKDHPLFSIIGCSCLLAAMLVFLTLGLTGKTRPEEMPPKSLTHVTQLGVVIAHGIDSHKDMVRLMRELSGLKQLPPPTHSVQGSAANPKNYIPLTEEQSNSIIERIEKDVEKLVSDAAAGIVEQNTYRQFGQLSSGEPSDPATVKGKAFVP